MPPSACAHRRPPSLPLPHCLPTQVNGLPACLSTSLLTTELRGRLGWKGFVSTDCGGEARAGGVHGEACREAWAG